MANPVRAFEWLVRLGLCGLFLYAGISKLGDPAAFAQDVSHYRVLPAAHVAGEEQRDRGHELEHRQGDRDQRRERVG